jgi:hypothetical protein
MKSQYFHIDYNVLGTTRDARVQNNPMVFAARKTASPSGAPNEGKR